MKPFLAVISPVASGAHPDHELPKPPATGAPPRPDHTLPGQLPRPEHPIYYPLPPGAPVDPEYGVPDTHPDQGLPKPPPRPDQGLPGPQPHPEHPIVLPPDTGGWLPIYIWGPTDPRPDQGLPGQPGQPPRPSQGPGFVTPPIVIPPPVETDDGQRVEFKPIWTPDNGWQVIGIVEPEKPIPTPSKKR
jgi:hypothetical protein